jgi:WD40 repeat protein
VAISPDSRWILSGGSDKTLKLWDMASGRLVRTFAEHSGEVTSVAFSPDGARVLGKLRQNCQALERDNGRVGTRLR